MNSFMFPKMIMTCNDFTIFFTLIGFLSGMYVLFYILAFSVLEKLYHIDNIHRVSLQYVFFYIGEGNSDVQRLYCTDYIHIVCLLFVCSFMYLETTEI